MNKLLKELTTFAICISFLGLHANAQISSSGNYTLMQTAIANGGASGNGSSLGGTYSIEGTIGQSVAGQTATAAPFSIHAGFWNAQPLAPSAANVSVSGIVQTAGGQGIRNIRVTMSSGDGTTQTALTGSFGYFRIDDVTTGQTYVLRISSKRYSFANPSQVLSVLEEVEDISFVSEEQ